MVRNMETTFYDDQNYHNISQLKRNMTLELGGHNTRQSKRPRLQHMQLQHQHQHQQQAPVLSSPDLHMLKLASPELEKFISGGGGCGLVTPSPASQILFPGAPTEEQEMYARPFVDALNELHHSDSSQGAPHPHPHPAATYTDLEKAGPYSRFPEGDLVIKDEPQTVPSIGSSSPPLSPIDMECQERIKLERKRQRNRVAASKCRRRKLERISRLEDKVKLLKGENTELNTIIMKLKEHVCMLKEQVMEHVNSGCQMMSY